MTDVLCPATTEAELRAAVMAIFFHDTLIKCLHILPVISIVRI